MGSIVLVALLLVSGWLLFDTLSHQGTPPGPTPTATLAAQATATASPTGQLSTGEPTPSPTATDGQSSPSPSPTPTPPPQGPVDMPFVPVHAFWTHLQGVTTADLAAGVAGTGNLGVALPANDAEAIADALGVELGSNVPTGTLDEVREMVRGGAVGVLRLSDVTPAVRVLDLDGESLFGNERLADLADWPLHARVDGPPVPDQAATWSLVAGGDILLDRGVANQITTLGRGADFPFDGGTARITKIVCCSSLDWPIPRIERTGNAGVVRELLSGADLTIANLETAVREGAKPSSGGLKFVANPKTLDGVARAGFDFLSLANNHIGNGGEEGILTAIEVLDELGIAHAGAGRTAADAAAPATFDINGTRVAIVACDWIAPRYWVRPDRVGSQSCREDSFTDAIGRAAADADVVIAFPHWGKEYRNTPRNYQRTLADEWIGAGATMIIGSHSHWAGAIEEIRGHLAFYSLGNLVFDQNWQTETQLGVVLELNWRGDQLVQAWLHPTIILDQAQPNLLNTEADLRRVLDQMWDGSKGLLPY